MASDDDQSVDDGPDGGTEERGANPFLSGLHAKLDRLEQLVKRDAAGMRNLEGRVLPAWRRVTAGEARWTVTIAIAVAIALQLALPVRLSIKPTWLLPSLEALLLVGLVVANPGRINRTSASIRVASLMLIATISVANAWSAGRLIRGLLNGTEGSDAGSLLATGGAIWLTNVVAFALWFWDLDRGGPAARRHGTKPHPDFMFAQMQNPDLAPDDWEPGFVDYLYLSFTNATAFSPTDTLPLSRWAKMAMLLQSAVSLMTVVLVIARAVNILK